MTDLPWWRKNYQFSIDQAVPKAFHFLAGPHGVATVKVYDDGRTQQGWGMLGKKKDDGSRGPNFPVQYRRRVFDSRFAVQAHKINRAPFAFVMRSMKLVCIDIDGKNGGFQGALQLGDLPPTLAETSKSGTGYHLFYIVDDEWDTTEGFAAHEDHIGIVEGVDIRATGCVFHYERQRWNDLPLAPLPEGIRCRLNQKEAARARGRIATNQEGMDMDDIIIAEHTLKEELAAPIAAGKRNNTLFAIGSKMRAAGIDGWDDQVHERAVQVGLDHNEADKLVRNIEAYGD